MDVRRRTPFALSRRGAALGALALAIVFAADASSSAQPLTIELDLQTAGGRVVSTPAGLACPPTCVAVFPATGSVSLAAQAAPGWRFGSWSTPACAGISPVCVISSERVTAGGHIHEHVSFSPESKLHLAVRGSGSVTLSPLGFDPVSGMQIGAECLSPSSNDAVRRTCVIGYPAGSRITVRPEAARGFQHRLWSRHECPPRQACTLNLAPGDLYLKSVFSGRRVLVDLREDEGNGGTVHSEPAGIVCPPVCTFDVASGEVVLTAQVRRGGFAGWGAACVHRQTPGSCLATIGGNPCFPGTTFSACRLPDEGQDQLATAWFARQPLIGTSPAGGREPLELDLGGTGAGRVHQLFGGQQSATCPQECRASFNRRFPVKLTAEAVTGSRFRGWRGWPCPTTVTPTCEAAGDEVDAVGACFNGPQRKLFELKVIRRTLRIRIAATPAPRRAQVTIVRGNGAKVAGPLAAPQPLRPTFDLKAPRGVRRGTYRLLVSVFDRVGCRWDLKRTREFAFPAP